jgi:aspartate aminotransferase
MEDYRLGYVVAAADLIKKLASFGQITITCVPKLIQMAGLACLEKEREILAARRDIWRQRVATGQELLSGIGFEFAPAQAGMYLFARHPKITDAVGFCERLLGKGLALAPGISFGPYPQFFRFCLNQDEQTLGKAADIISGLL